MVLVVLISCVSKKLDHKAQAKYMYTSNLFKYSLKYAQKLNPDKIFILSAKYHLLYLDREIEPYNVTLNKMPVKERKLWAEEIIRELSENADLENDKFIILAGENYAKFIRDKLKYVEEPLKGLSIGNRLNFLKSKS